MFTSAVIRGITLRIESARFWIFRFAGYSNCEPCTLAAACVDDRSRTDHHNNTMNRILYLHIGLHKTGTSAIQRFLGYDRAVLGKMGVIVPGDQVDVNLHHHIALQASIWANAETARKKFRNTIEPIAYLGERIVLSSEVFAGPNIHIKVLDELTSYFSTIRVIVYLRRGDTMIESAYNQIVNGGIRLTPVGTISCVPECRLVRRGCTLP